MMEESKSWLKDKNNIEGILFFEKDDVPVCLPFLFASLRSCTRAREWTTVGFLMIKPSLWRRATLRRELAREISFTSLGSNQILRSPHLRTEAAKRFWSLKDTVISHHPSETKHTSTHVSSSIITSWNHEHYIFKDRDIGCIETVQGWHSHHSFHILHHLTHPYFTLYYLVACCN